MYDVITIGSALRDIIFVTDELMVHKNPVFDPNCEQVISVEYGTKIHSQDVRTEFGGGATNTAVNFAGLGLKTGILSVVGDDMEGQAIIQNLKKRGVDTKPMHIDKQEQSAFSFILVDPKSGDHTIFSLNAIMKGFSVSKAELKRHSTKWHYVASSLHSKDWKKTIEYIAKAPSKFAWNPGTAQLAEGYTGLKPFFPHIDVLILNKDEATELFLSHESCTKPKPIKTMAKIIHSWGPKVVLITNSRKGTHAYDGEQFYYVQPPQDEPRDTTGAGDSFGSSFIAGLVQYDDIQRAMELATYQASQLVKKVGAQNGLKSWKELPKRFTKR